MNVAVIAFDEPERCGRAQAHARSFTRRGDRVTLLPSRTAAAAGLTLARPQLVLVLNAPPASIWAAARLCRATLVIDWRDLPAEPSRWSHRADRHLCPSQAMRAELEKRGIRAELLPDRPIAYREHVSDPDAVLRVACPAAHDMTLLFDALEACGSEIAMEVCIIGPLHQSAQNRVNALRRNGVDVHAQALSTNDYWDLLSGAGVGVSLHPGPNLSPQVVDLFAARVPVVAFNYGPTIKEQITPGRTGILFRTSGELAILLDDFCTRPERLAAIRSAIQADWTQTWDDLWPTMFP